MLSNTFHGMRASCSRWQRWRTDWFWFPLAGRKKTYKFFCVDVLQLDGCSRVKHAKLKTTLIGKKILENSVIFVYQMTC